MTKITKEEVKKVAHLSRLKGNKLVKKTFAIVCLLVGVSLVSKSIMNFFIN